MAKNRTDRNDHSDAPYGPGSPDVDHSDPYFQRTPPEYYEYFEPGDIVFMGKPTLVEGHTPLPDGQVHPDTLVPEEREREQRPQAAEDSLKAFDSAYFLKHRNDPGTL